MNALALAADNPHVSPRGDRFGFVPSAGPIQRRRSVTLKEQSRCSIEVAVHETALFRESASG